MPAKSGKIDFLAAERSPFALKPMGWSQLIAWVFPNSYEVGMANIGYQWLFGQLRAQKHLLTERFFYTNGEPLSLEGGRPLSSFPIICVSMPFELDFLNLLDMMRRSGIPLLSSERRNKHLLIGGGDAFTINPFPFADFFDIIVLGRGEAWAREFPELVRKMPQGLALRDDLLHAARSIAGVWVPSLDDGGEILRAIEISDCPAYSPILTSFGHFRNMFLVEAQRGCPFDCAFCASSWLGRPRSDLSAKSILEVYDKFGFSAGRVGLVGNALSEHNELDELLDGLVSRGIEGHPSSIRLDRISNRALDLLAKSGLKKITFAPETASERLGKAIGKWISPESIVEMVERLEHYGVVEMKLYWIVGLPGETETDVSEMARTIRMISTASEMRITASINPFIPKPHSRFFDEKMLADAELSQRFAELKRSLKGLRNLSLELNYSKRSRLSALLSTADASIAPALKRIAEGGGIKKILSDYGIALDDSIVAAENHPTKRIV